MTTQTITRNDLHTQIDNLSDAAIEKLAHYIAFLNYENFADKPHIPNAETDGLVNDDGFYDEANIRWLKGSIDQLKQGKVVVKTLEELEKMADE
jgi:hypothetical protein